MTVLENVFDSLKQMTLLQLLFSFLVCICYAALQGALISGGAKAFAAALGVLSALGFVVTGNQWVYGFMLLAFAVAGLGIFAAIVWLLGGLLDFNGRGAPRVLDSVSIETDAESRPTTPATLAGRPMATSHWTLPSH